LKEAVQEDEKEENRKKGKENGKRRHRDKAHEGRLIKRKREMKGRGKGKK
jgi:hypothetical protein